MPPAHDCFGRGCELAGHFRFGRRGGRDNAILVTHHFSGTSHAAGRYRADDAQPGSWDAIVGPGKAIDTDRYYVVSSDTLVSLNAKDPDTVTTGPASVDPATGRPHGMSFPIVTIRDSVNVQKALLDLWAAPIRLDPAWNGDDYYGRAEPARGLVEALKLVTLQATQWHWVDRVFGRSWADPAKSPAHAMEHRFAVGPWLEQTAAARAALCDANHFLYLARADQLFLLGHGGSVEA